MGLDNYFERTQASPKQISFPDNLSLCGGVFSGHGEGSFRGNVYTQFFEQNFQPCVNLYGEIYPDEIARIAKDLSTLVESHPNQSWNGDSESWQEDSPYASLGYYGVTTKEVQDLAALFQAAAEQNLRLTSSF